MSCLFTCSICSEANTHAHALTDRVFPRVMNCSFVLPFPVQIIYSWRVHTGLEKKKLSGLRFVCVLHYRVWAWVRWWGWGLKHIAAEPNLSWVRTEEPKKTLDVQNKTLSMEMDIFTPSRTTAEWLFNGKQGNAARPARKISMRNIQCCKNSRILQGYAINNKTRIWMW